MTNQQKNRRGNKNGIRDDITGECFCEDAKQVQELCNSGQQSHARYVFGSLLMVLQLIGIDTNHDRIQSRWGKFITKLINATVLCVMINDVFVIFIHNITPSLFRNMLCSLYVGSAIYSHRKLRMTARQILDTLDKHSYLIVSDKQGIKFIRRWSLILTISGILLMLAYLIASIILVRFYGFNPVINAYALGLQSVSTWISVTIWIMILISSITIIMPLYYFVAFYSLITWFLSCLFSNHYRLTVRSIRIKPSSQKEHIQQSFSLYCHLCELVKVIDGIYNYPSLMWFSVSLLLIISLAHNFIAASAKMNLIIDWGMYFIPVVFSLFAFVVQCCAGDALSKNSKSLIPSLRKFALKQSFTVPNISNLVDLIIERMRLNPPILTVFGYFEINRTLILSLFSMVIAYMAVVSQIPSEQFD